MPPIINKEKCVGCGLCTKICPTDVIHVVAGEKVPQVSYPEECWHCNSCVLDCSANAIKLRIPLPAMMLYVDARTIREIEGVVLSASKDCGYGL